MDIAIGTDCQGPARMVRQAGHLYIRPRRATLLLFRAWRGCIDRRGSWRGCIDWRGSWRRGGRKHIDPGGRRRRRWRKNRCRGRRTGHRGGRSGGSIRRRRASGRRRRGNGRRWRYGLRRRHGRGGAFNVAVIYTGLLQQVSATFVTAGKRPNPSQPTPFIDFVVPLAVIHVVHKTTPAKPAGRRARRSYSWRRVSPARRARPGGRCTRGSGRSSGCGSGCGSDCRGGRGSGCGGRRCGYGRGEGWRRGDGWRKR